MPFTMGQVLSRDRLESQLLQTGQSEDLLGHDHPTAGRHIDAELRNHRYQGAA